MSVTSCPYPQPAIFIYLYIYIYYIHPSTLNDRLQPVTPHLQKYTDFHHFNWRRIPFFDPFLIVLFPFRDSLFYIRTYIKAYQFVGVKKSFNLNSSKGKLIFHYLILILAPNDSEKNSSFTYFCNYRKRI